MDKLPFAAQFDHSQIAHGAGIPVGTFEVWVRRYALLVPVGERAKQGVGSRSRRYSVIDVAVVAAVRALTERGIPPRFGAPWCAATLPKHFNEIFRRERVAIADVRRPSDGKMVRLDLNGIAVEVLKRLDFGVVQSGPTPLSEAAMMAEVARFLRYQNSKEYRDRLAAFCADVTHRGTPATWDEAAQALGLPLWIVRLARAEAVRIELAEIGGSPPAPVSDIQRKSRMPEARN
jgi:hypothetical protein